MFFSIKGAGWVGPDPYRKIPLLSLFRIVLYGIDLISGWSKRLK